MGELCIHRKSRHLKNQFNGPLKFITTTRQEKCGGEQLNEERKKKKQLPTEWQKINAHYDFFGWHGRKPQRQMPTDSPIARVYREDAHSYSFMAFRI